MLALQLNRHVPSSCYCVALCSSDSQKTRVSHDLLDKDRNFGKVAPHSITRFEEDTFRIIMLGTNE